MDKRPLLVSSRSIIDAFDAGCSRAGGHGDICAGPSLAEFPTKVRTANSIDLIGWPISRRYSFSGTP